MKKLSRICTSRVIVWCGGVQYGQDVIAKPSHTFIACQKIRSTTECDITPRFLNKLHNNSRTKVTVIAIIRRPHHIVTICKIRISRKTALKIFGN